MPRPVLTWREGTVLKMHDGDNDGGGWSPRENEPRYSRRSDGSPRGPRRYDNDRQGDFGSRRRDDEAFGGNAYQGGDGFQSRGFQGGERAERGPRQGGTVKFFKADKGYGFITPDSGQSDVFVHISAVERSGLNGLDSGQKISFETEPDRRGRGPKAVNLQLED